MPPSLNNPPRHRRKITSLLVLLAWLAAIGGLAANRQNLIDYAKLRNYQAPPAIAKFADQDTMTTYGRKIFYVNHPAIETKGDFNKFCPNASNGGEQTIVLGCYYGNQQGIFLLTVSDPRLDGVQQVTAAHEMLHGAYDRLSTKERARIDSLLLNFYHNDLKDQRLKDVVDAYKKSEPNDVVNEMHSIFGTEVTNLPTDLEAYYQRYFTDRHAVSGFADRYQSEFTSRQAAVIQDDAKLATLRTQIDSTEADLKAKEGSISTQQADLVAKRNSGNVAAYNAGVAPFNALVDNYNSGVRSIQGLIAQYNQIVAHRNSIALEEDQLVKDLTSTVNTIDSN